jgi:hypothetical protein
MTLVIRLQRGDELELIKDGGAFERCIQDDAHQGARGPRISQALPNSKLFLSYRLALATAIAML